METTWTATVKDPEPYPSLASDHATDVLVVGGGLAGIITAYLLAKEGYAVTVIDKKKIGMDTTAFTTAFATQLVDTALGELISLFGEGGARLVWESHAAAIDLIGEIVSREKLDCEFVRVPVRVYANEQKEAKDLLEEKNAAKKIGFKTEIRSGEGLGFSNSGVWEVPDQAKFHPLKLVFGLAGAASGLGIKIYEKTEAVKIVKGNRPSVELANGRRVKANHVIVATYYPFHKPKATFLKKGMYVSYVIEAELPKAQVPEGLYLDLANPYHYFRVDRTLRGSSGQAGSADRLILGGADHREELKIPPAKNYEDLKEHMAAIFGAPRPKMVRKWDGPILEPSDGIALIGETERRQFVATAFSGNGMTYSGIAGLMARDWVLGKKNPWEALYDPKRKLTVKRFLKKAGDYAGEFVGGALRNALRHSK